MSDAAAIVSKGQNMVGREKFLLHSKIAALPMKLICPIDFSYKFLMFDKREEQMYI